jgi:glycosyltransferase involved in cell wall biosynthesis
MGEEAITLPPAEDAPSLRAPVASAMGDRALTVMLVHNRYLQRGGEDTVFEAEANLLEQAGCRVIRLEAQSRMPDGFVDSLRLAGSAIWSLRWYRSFRQAAARVQPDVVHIHNFFPNISPAVFYAAGHVPVPIVMTLHNFRLLCPAGDFFRAGRLCHDCVGRGVAWPAIAHGCYRGSRAGSAVVAGMLALSRALGIWRTRIACFIALSQASRDQLARGGIPREKMVVKPNFTRDLLPWPPADTINRCGGLFVGRLSPEKGIDTLVRAWAGMGAPLRVIGDGPLAADLKENSGIAVELAGWKTPIEVSAAMRRAAFVVAPSRVQENFPMAIAEAFCNGAPVIASRLGAMAELVQDGETGLHFNPADAIDLRAKVRWALDHPAEMSRMGRNARQVYEQKYNPRRNLLQLLSIYRQAITGMAWPGL